ncbi:MAG: toll/interleukin-1 receptor domain-containing protein [Chloroflexota bacterium]
MRVFISHISEEAAIARVLKDWIESSFAGQCDVFVSSDKDDIPAGSRWLEDIDGAVASASALIVLCSPSSLSRPWIIFETGCGWAKRVPIIPICHSGQKKGALPPPISMLESLELDDKDFVNDLLSSLATHHGLAKFPRVDQAAMRRELLEAAGQIAACTTPPPSKDEAGKATELRDEIAWRLDKMVEMFGILAEGVQTGNVTTQDYQDISRYIDKLFSGEAYFYKQSDHEKLAALAAKVTRTKAEDIGKLKAFLDVVERTHRQRRDYGEILSQLEGYQALLHSQPDL